jgi:hypothetical protein
LRRLTGPIVAALAGAGLLLAASAGAHASAHCSVYNAGGSPNSAALGGWAYDVGFTCPYKVESFSITTNKRLHGGTDKTGITTPYASAELKNGQQVDFKCKVTSSKAFKCTSSSGIPAHIQIGDGFDSSTKCTNTNSGQLKAHLRVNGKPAHVSFNGKTDTGSLTGGCG